MSNSKRSSSGSATVLAQSLRRNKSYQQCKLITYFNNNYIFIILDNNYIFMIANNNHIFIIFNNNIMFLYEIIVTFKMDLKQQVLPLARIKKIMKLDDDVKMISAEAPLLFAKAAEIFIHELTLRSWIHTEDNKRRTLQRNDIAMAITKFDQFDFLIDIVPRDDIKPNKPREDGVRPGGNSDQVCSSSHAVFLLLIQIMVTIFPLFRVFM